MACLASGGRHSEMGGDWVAAKGAGSAWFGAKGEDWSRIAGSATDLLSDENSAVIDDRVFLEGTDLENFARDRTTYGVILQPLLALTLINIIAQL